jgi:hypothetical protein
MKGYMVRKWSNNIEPIEFVSESEHFLTVQVAVGVTRREKKISEYQRYFAEWAGARAYLISRATDGVRSAQQRLDAAKAEEAEVAKIPESDPSSARAS